MTSRRWIGLNTPWNSQGDQAYCLFNGTYETIMTARANSLSKETAGKSPQSKPGSHPAHSDGGRPEPLICRLNAEVLTDAGYRVDTAEDGLAAWHTLQFKSYNLLITDNEMPHVTGMDLLIQMPVCPPVAAGHHDLRDPATRGIKEKSLATLHRHAVQALSYRGITGGGAKGPAGQSIHQRTHHPEPRPAEPFASLPLAGMTFTLRDNDAPSLKTDGTITHVRRS